MSTQNKALQHCAFCGTQANKCAQLVTMPTGISICDKCIKQCNKILLKKQQKKDCQLKTLAERKKPSTPTRLCHTCGKPSGGNWECPRCVKKRQAKGV